MGQDLMSPMIPGIAGVPLSLTKSILRVSWLMILLFSIPRFGRLAGMGD